jgi:hypothetical protein
MPCESWDTMQEKRNVHHCLFPLHHSTLLG